MKVYDIMKVKNGFQIIWFWNGDYIKTGFKAYKNFVKNGFFKTKLEAQKRANDLQLQEY